MGRKRGNTAGTAAAGKDHRLHNENRHKISRRGMPVFTQEQDPNIARGMGAKRIYALFCVQAAGFEMIHMIDMLAFKTKIIHNV